jgi:hypothetical protein
MRIDRDGFLVLALSTFVGCERADAVAPMAPERFVAAGPVEPVQLTVRESEVAHEPPPPPKPLTALQHWFRGLSEMQQTNITGLCEQRRKEPCAALMRMIPVAPGTDRGPDLEERFLAGLSDFQRNVAGRYCVERSGMPAPTSETPLVVAFENHPVDFAPANDAAFAFVPGKPMISDWPTAVTPWIARDLDGDGAITTGAELFGSSTALAVGTAKNGFQALASLDANGDGVIDARDPAFAELVLWSDLDGNHRSSPNELRPLASVVSSISLEHTLDPRCTARGACVGERSTLRWRDATGAERTGAVIDVYLPKR